MKYTDADILFVTGKGGVGKSVVAASVALQQARVGKKVLLAELGAKSFFSEFLSLNVGYDPIPTPGQFDIACWEADAAIKEYILYYFKLKTMYNLIFENAMARTLLKIAPSASELAILGKITSGIRQVGPPLNYDLIVVDSYATGHFRALLKAPMGIREAISHGPIAKESQSMIDIIQDPKLSQFLIVSLPEELPVIESQELYQSLKVDCGREAEVFLNRTVPQMKADELIGSEPFVEFIRGRLALQDWARGELPTVSCELPLVAEHEGWKLIERLAECLS